MSDRYYTQMARAIKMTDGELKQNMRTEEGREKIQNKIDKVSLNSYTEAPTKKKVTKKDLSNKICADLDIKADLAKANMEALGKMVDAIKTKKITCMPVPEGRLKRPYLETLIEMIGVKEDGIEHLTVASMRSLIEGLINLRAK